jgi:iron complex outermembrane receptor protein
VYGLRLATEQHLGASDRSPRVTAGLDMQRLRDDRSNFRAVAGVPDTAILDQQERVTEIGPFIQIHANPVPDLVVGAGGRYDRSLFVVQDRHLSDGVDNTGDRTMSAFSANGGIAWVRDLRFGPYVNVSTSFETPTTTELANQPNSSGGFNTSLDPQRTVNFELGARGTVGRLTYSLTGYLSRIKDAIVQYQEVSGRAYFTNAGKVKNDGLELGLSAAVTGGLRVFGNYTWSDFRFDEYRIERSVNNAIVIDTLDGNRLPGVPKAFIRLGVRAGPFRGFSADLDHTMASSMYADDRNTLSVDGFGSSPQGNIRGLGNGVTNVRFSWEGRAGGAWVRPFIGVNNLWDRTYVGSFTINGTFGRVFETAPGRNYYIGGEIGWAAR